MIKRVTGHAAEAIGVQGLAVAILPAHMAWASAGLAGPAHAPRRQPYGDSGGWEPRLALS